MGRSMSDSMMNIHFLTILREDEFRELKKVFPHDNELLHDQSDTVKQKCFGIVFWEPCEYRKKMKYVHRMLFLDFT